jgi:ribosomal protein S18 acetylase RimI-like enzyme
MSGPRSEARAGAGHLPNDQYKSRQKKYRTICLDTLPTMTGAIALYRSLGFTQAEAYCHNPIAGALFFARKLPAARPC